MYVSYHDDEECQRILFCTIDWCFLPQIVVDRVNGNSTNQNICNASLSLYESHEVLLHYLLHHKAVKSYNDHIMVWGHGHSSNLIEVSVSLNEKE